MALRPLAFGVRKRGRDRTVEVRSHRSGKAVIEVRRRGKTERREHTSLGSALSDLARTWRNRLN